VNLRLCAGIKNKKDLPPWKGPAKTTAYTTTIYLSADETSFDLQLIFLLVIKKIRCRPPSTDTLTDAQNLTHTLLACVIASFIGKVQWSKVLKAITN
jgi:hypothetical protein